ncbi:growth factor independent 1 [Microdochium nivale]|nr:growth factor independent 1 [Microdochium nivale]
MNRSRHRDNTRQPNIQRHSHHGIDSWTPSSAFTLQSFELYMKKRELVSAARIVDDGRSPGGLPLHHWQQSTDGPEVSVATGTFARTLSGTEKAAMNIHEFDGCWTAAKDSDPTRNHPRQMLSDGGETGGSLLQQPKPLLHSGNKEKSPGPTLLHTVSEQTPVSPGDDWDTDTDSPVTSNQGNDPGLPIAVTDQPRLAPPFNLPTLIHNDWKGWTAGPGLYVVQPGRGEKPSGKRPRQERRDPQQSHKRSKKQEKQGKGAARDIEGDDYNSGDSDDDDGDGDGDGDGGRCLRSDVLQPTLACPYYKDDNIRHAKCLRHFTRISDVKQHLRRDHKRPLFCQKCGKEFKPQSSQDYKFQARLDDHADARSCERQDFEKPEGDTEDQIQELGARVSASATLPAQWYSIWDIVFPGKARPNTPFVLNYVDEICYQILVFYDLHGQTSITRCLESQSRLTNSDDGILRDVGTGPTRLFTFIRAVLIDLAHLRTSTSSSDTRHEDVDSSFAQSHEEVLQQASAPLDDATEASAEHELAGSLPPNFFSGLVHDDPMPFDGVNDLESFNFDASEDTTRLSHDAQEMGLGDGQLSQCVNPMMLHLDNSAFGFGGTGDRSGEGE